jgi:hypothetical protein
MLTERSQHAREETPSMLEIIRVDRLERGADERPDGDGAALPPFADSPREGIEHPSVAGAPHGALPAMKESRSASPIRMAEPTRAYRSSPRSQAR